MTFLIVTLLFLFQGLHPNLSSNGIQVSQTYKVGFRKIILEHPRTSDPQKKVRLVLNLWYPTNDTSSIQLDLIDFLYNHLDERIQITDSLKEAKLSILASDLQNWFGDYNDERFAELTNIKSTAYINAEYHPQRFPLILGRLRVFSTTLTNEFLASKGYIVGMLTGVDDFPPNNRHSYLKQVEDEIVYFSAIRKHLFRNLKITSNRVGLMGFSGNGISPFLSPMFKREFSCVALIESGVFLKDIYAILSDFRYYNEHQYPASLLFLYNKQLFESNNMRLYFDKIVAQRKHLILFDEPEQHHWDVATEGVIAAQYLGIRKASMASRQATLFNSMNTYLLNYFDSNLKGSTRHLPEEEIVK